MNFKLRSYQFTNCLTYSSAIESNVAPKQNEVTKRMPAETLQCKKNFLIELYFGCLLIIARYLFWWDILILFLQLIDGHRNLYIRQEDYQAGAKRCLAFVLLSQLAANHDSHMDLYVHILNEFDHLLLQRHRAETSEHRNDIHWLFHETKVRNYTKYRKILQFLD